MSEGDDAMGVEAAAAPARSPERDEEWAALLERVAAGDRRALSDLYDASHRLIYYMALRILRDEAAAEDATVDTFTSVWRSAGRFDRKRGSASAWLFTLVRNRAIDRLRAESRHAGDPLDAADHLSADGRTPEESASIEQQRVVLRRCMNELDGKQRQAIELAYFDGLSHSEIASHLGEPLGTIKARVRRGMSRLREQLALVL